MSGQQELRLAEKNSKHSSFERVIDDIRDLNWSRLTREGLIEIAWVYYFFSIQFRENLEIARSLYPDDAQLEQLDRGERDTDNLSPWPEVAVMGERMNHDEFMRRTLELTTIAASRQRRLKAIGESYLAKVRAMDKTTRAMSIASYEDGGLETVFRAILKAQDWDDPLLEAFRHFLTEHIRFDSDPEQGHGALARHLMPDERIIPLWAAFKEMLIEGASELAG